MPSSVVTERLRDLGHGMEEALLVAWRIAEGDDVSEDDVIAEIETDKATVEFCCTVSGRIAEILIPARQIVRVGDPLCLIEKAD
jgi:pyruvate/2-oxoglutarate dehydrogenase complex dihydrolipoamide acyltransferase (E2) component